MELQSKKLSNHEVATGLAMVGISVSKNVAGLIQDTIHALIDQGDQFDLNTAVSIQSNYNSDETVIGELNAQYRVLSELYNPKSKHKTQINIGLLLNDILKQIENINKNGTN
jgi:hypothetical protein